MNQEQILAMWKAAGERGLTVNKHSLAVRDGVMCSFTVLLGQTASSIAEVKQAELSGEFLIIESRDHAFTFIPQSALLAIVVKPPRDNGDRSKTGF